MRPLRITVLVVATAVMVMIAGGTTASSGASTSYVQASAREFYYGLSRSTVRPGSVKFEVVNFGEDDHDLAITRKGGSTIAVTAEIKPGEYTTVTRKLRRGSYVLWCTISDHKSRGMRAVLRVKPKKTS
ncbi:MAG: hypothetical protein WAP35_09500 [Solirubrobacterales bacterium]